VITEVSPLATVVLDGSGNGQCAVGPPSGTRWALRLATVATSTATKQPQAKFYRGSASGPLELLDFTYTGSSASSGKVGGAIYYPGQQLWAVWSGGDAGATATLQAYGQQGNRSDPLQPAPLGEGFANNTATIVVAGGSGAQIVITTVIPPEITAFYGAQGWSVVAGIFYYFNTTDYWYEIDLNPTLVQLHATGFGIGGVVHENELNQWITAGTLLDKFIGLNQIVSTQYGRPGRTPDPSDHLTIADSATLNVNGTFFANGAFTAANATFTGNVVVDGNLTVIGVGETLFVRKTADQSRTNNATLVNDLELFFVGLPANTSWEVLGHIIFQANGAAAANGYRAGWSAPAGSTFDWVWHGKIDTDGTATASTIWQFAETLATTRNSGGAGAGVSLVAKPSGLLVIGNTAGTFQFQFSQATAGGAGVASITKAGSYIVMRRVL
jgi:hypothetical protein